MSEERLDRVQAYYDNLADRLVAVVVGLDAVEAVLAHGAHPAGGP